MTSTPRKFRSDLSVSQQKTAEGTFFIVRDPVSYEFYRFREPEQFIAQQFDGETPLEAIRQRAEEKFGAALSAETLSAFAQNLERTGLLEGENGTRERRARKRSRIRGSLVYLRFKILDPNQIFDWLIRRMRFFFTPHFLAFSTALILAAAGTTLANWGEITQELPRVYRPSAIPLFLAVIFLLVSAHEFAHGLTCKHFGGEVRELGFMLIYFQPAFYCNVSDAWLFPEKAKRLWVGFAGPYFELFLWALATFAWRVTDTETWIHNLGLIAMTTSGVKTLFNLSPFIKLDGYYLLSDYLEIPNLRRKSYRYIGSLIEKLLRLERQGATAISRRERRIYFLYGLVAIFGTFSLLAYVIVTAGGYLFKDRGAGAAILSSALLGFKLRRKFRRMFGNSSDVSDPEDDGEVLGASNGGALPEAPDSEKNPERKRTGRWNARIVWGALTAAALAFVFLGRMELRIAGPLEILPKENADVRAAVDGIVEKIYVDEGEEVRAGKVIARLSASGLLNDLQRTEAEIKETRAKLEMLRATPTAQEIEAAKGAVAKAEGRRRYAQSLLGRFRLLSEENVLSRRDLDGAEDLASTAENELVESKARLNALLLGGALPEEIEATSARAQWLETQRQYLQGQLRSLTVVSPVAGIVATPSRQLKEMRGQVVRKGDLIAKVYDFKTVTAQIVISEKEIADVRVGQDVVVRTRAYPTEKFYGTVTSIAPSAEGSSMVEARAPSAGRSSHNAAGANTVVRVSTEIDNHSLLLKPEMTGEAKILCGQRRVLDLITRRLEHTFNLEFWSWW